MENPAPPASFRSRLWGRLTDPTVLTLPVVAPVFWAASRLSLISPTPLWLLCALLATSFLFTVSLSGQPLYPVTVDYTTGGGTATASSDYLPTGGTLGFPAGVNTRTITVTVIGDGIQEQNESFYVNLSNPSPNAYLGDAQGLGTIGNDD